MKKITKNGISLILLIITIIIILIISGIIMFSLASNNLISTAFKASFLKDIKTFQEDLNMYQTQRFTETLGTYQAELLQANEYSVTYNDIVDYDQTIQDIIPTLAQNDEYNEEFIVLNGKLVYVGEEEYKQSWVEDLGLKTITTGKPTVSIYPKDISIVKQSTDLTYILEFSSENATIRSVNLSNKIFVLDDENNVLTVQPSLEIGNLSGTILDSVRQVEIVINTSSLESGDYKLKILPGAVTNSNNLSNFEESISLIGFTLDNDAPINPIMEADITNWTNGNVLVTITYSADSVKKEYSFDALIWNSYIDPIVVTDNNTTVYARGLDIAGNDSSVATMTIANIDKTSPIITFETNGGINLQTANTIVTVNDLGSSGIDDATLQYVWSTQNTSMPTTSWSPFVNSNNCTISGVSGTYYLWVKAGDNAGNNVVNISNSFSLDNLPPINPTMAVDETGWTDKNVNVTIVYTDDSIIKEYSIDGSSWNTYTGSVSVSENNTTVYARGIDAAGNDSSVATITIANIDKETFDYVKKHNKPKIETGLTPIVFNSSGVAVNTTISDINWYSYEDQGTWKNDGKTSKWANAKTSDGSMWVWIPRYAYKIASPYTYYSSETDVIFLKGTTNKYEDSNGVEKDLPSGYIVHPAFTDESASNYANGGWNSELTGIWVSKFEAGFAGGGNSIVPINSNLTYTGVYSSVKNFHYSSNIVSGVTKIKYPVFLPDTYSYNYISIGDTYAICKALDDSGNPYGLSSNANSHMIKNSEWGAVAYLTHSQYGRNGVEVTVNTKNVNDSTLKVYVVTGYGGSSSRYNTTTGMRASTTGNVYGIYDMSGGSFERTAGYMMNPASLSIRSDYGGALVTEGGNISTKYKSIYLYSSSDTRIANRNAGTNETRKGEAIWETSSTDGSSCWFSDYSDYMISEYCFLARSSYTDTINRAGIFSYYSSRGKPYHFDSFRAVLAYPTF